MKKNSQLILDLVNRSCDHLNAEQLFLLAKQQSPKIALSTVYNNLNYLTAEGAIRRIVIEGAPDVYDRATPHDHLICLRCGSVTDIHLPDLTPVIEEQAGTSIISYDLTIKYVCPRCKTQENE